MTTPEETPAQKQKEVEAFYAEFKRLDEGYVEDVMLLLKHKDAVIAEFREAGETALAALHDLKESASRIQEYFGIKPEDSKFIRNATEAQKKLVEAIATADADVWRG